MTSLTFRVSYYTIGVSIVRYKKGNEMNTNMMHHQELNDSAVSMWAVFWPNVPMPNLVITLARKNQVAGWFIPDILANRSGIIACEIALNPMYVAKSTRPDVISTIAHELVHHWQHHFGEPGKRGYHNKQWAEEMIRIGLKPFTADGKQTGYAVSHTIIPDGLFDKWYRAVVEQSCDGVFGDKIMLAEPEAGEGGEGSEGEGEKGNEPEKKKDKSKVKFTCPSCGQNAWAKETANLLCGECSTEDNLCEMRPVD